MLLQRLSEYADRFSLPPPMYQHVPVRYIIQIDRTGHPLGRPVDTATPENKRGIARLVPNLKRTSGVKPILLADNAAYTLGYVAAESKPERVRQQHEEFVALVRQCAAVTSEPAVLAVAQFLDTFDLARLPLHDDFDPGANITFEVEGVYPADLPAVHAFWAEMSSLPDDTEMVECLVCGQMRSPVERLPISIKGIPGGQTSGMALISANALAFESYGLKASLIAPTCEDCGQRFGNALNFLLAQPDTRLYVAPVVYIFWSREPIPFSPVPLLSSANHDEVRRFLTSAWRASPEGARIDTMPYYAAALSASGARVVVRDWIETTLGEAQRHLERYFRLQGLVSAQSGQMRWFPLFRLAQATTNSKSKKEDPPAQVVQALLHVALAGGMLPDWLLYQAIRRTRAEQRVSAEHAAIIKMVLLSRREREGGMAMGDMAELDRANREPAYLCGRLLAELEAIQYAALGKTNRTLVDSYYGTASSAPATVFGRLMNGARAHLTKLRHEKPGLHRMLDQRLQEILEGLPSFPRTLVLVDQGVFALGFYHQRAANYRDILARKAARGATPSADPVADVEELYDQPENVL